VGAPLSQKKGGRRPATKKKRTREALLATVGAGVAVRGQAGDDGHIQAKGISEPINGGARLVGQCVNQVRASLSTSGRQGVLFKDFRGIRDAQLQFFNTNQTSVISQETKEREERRAEGGGCTLRCEREPAALMPLVALVEFPPQKGDCACGGGVS